ncbi:MAG: hypothetical protein WB588_07520 [Dehalococcoidia bacterium]
MAIMPKTLNDAGVEDTVVAGPVEVGAAAHEVKTISKAAIVIVKKENRLIILTMYTPLWSQAFQSQNQSGK